MTKTEEIFEEILSRLPEAKKSKMFGATCIKAPNGKAVLMIHSGNTMVFKLQEPDAQEALSLDGVKVFEPMEGRPMGGWIQVPYAYAGKWPAYAEKAMEFVRKIKK